MTKLINIKNAPEDWRNDDSYVYIGRPGPYGNRYCINPMTRLEVLEAYRKDGPPANLESLRDKILVCHCKPLPCHGDILIEWLNEKS